MFRIVHCNCSKLMSIIIIITPVGRTMCIYFMTCTYKKSTANIIILII